MTIPQTLPILIRCALIALATIAIVIAAFALAGNYFNAPRYSGPITDHFDGKLFHNEPESPRHSFGDFVRWRISRKPGTWQDIHTAPGSAPPMRVDGTDLRVTYVGHSTLLIQTAGLNILTDPIWSDRASPLSWIGPKRWRSVGIKFDDLPPIDVVLVSHNHYDHMDLKTLSALSTKHHPKIFTPLGNGSYLASKGISGAIELDWWQEVNLSPDTKLIEVPAQHFSSRGMGDRNRAFWSGFVISGALGNIYFAGDTGMGPHIEEISRRFGPIRLSMLPIGAYLPKWFMKPMHLSPEDAIEAHRILNSKTTIAVHFGTFALGDDGQDDTPEILANDLKAAAIPQSEFMILNPGDGRALPLN